jgi:hypothetical protein
MATAADSTLAKNSIARDARLDLTARRLDERRLNAIWKCLLVGVQQN